MPSRRTEQIALTILDALVFTASLWLAIVVRYGSFVPPPETWWALAAAPFVGVACLVPFRFYHQVIRYVGVGVAYRCVLGVVLTTITLLAASFLRGGDPAISRLVFVPFAMSALLGLMSLRVGGRFLMRRPLPLSTNRRRRVLIYGAGEAGVGLLSLLEQDASLQVVCFVDDAKRLGGRDVRGVRVHRPEQLPQLLKRYEIDTVMLAIPSASRARRRELLDQFRGLRVKILTVPDMAELDGGTARFTDLRPIQIEDLLGRESVLPDPSLLDARIKGRVVLVTGAGGSIGSELCRQIVTRSPARLILVDNCEFNLYRVEAELEEQNSGAVTVAAVLGSVCDRLQMRQLMQRFRVDTVYHAAAYKHVPIVEDNAVVGVANNVLGTLRTAEAAINARVKDFVLVSTDKAVRPTSVMGASKRLAELVLQGLHEEQDGAGTRFSMVRFGNVLGSSGSAVPKFTSQIQSGGPVTVTHPEVTRYFMTIQEAANLVIQSSSLAQGGDVFVLDMGEPVRIHDLAVRMIELAGATVRSDENPTGEIEIRFTGLRQGEKLYEELLIDGDLESTRHPKIRRSAEHFIRWPELAGILQRLEAAIDRRDEATVLQVLQETVSEYSGPAANVPIEF
jgi:FlaA1/EpsC-like NDP-sugar epimerase